MPTLGMIGGLGSESTIDYYRRILEAWERVEPGTAPSIVIDSLDVRRALRLVESDRPGLIDYLLASLRRLAGAGVDFAVMTATWFTMEGPFYPEVCARYGITVVPPEDADRAWVHERYIEELLRGEFRDDTRWQFISLVSRLRDEKGVEGVILGGTELPLLLSTPVIAGIPALDTTALHVAAIVRRLRE